MRYLSGKEKKELSKDLPSIFSIEKKDEIIEFKDILFKNKKHFLINTINLKHTIEHKYIPHLKSDFVKNLKTITIDTGAVSFLLKGADMMKPGIVAIDPDIEKGDIVSIIDEVKGLKVGVGSSLYSSNEMNSMKSGKAILTLHYFKDDYYTIDL